MACAAGATTKKSRSNLVSNQYAPAARRRFLPFPSPNDLTTFVSPDRHQKIPKKEIQSTGAAPYFGFCSRQIHHPENPRKKLGKPPKNPHHHLTHVVPTTPSTTPSHPRTRLVLLDPSSITSVLLPFERSSLLFEIAHTSPTLPKPPRHPVRAVLFALAASS